jgi:hypothetical protein
VLGRQHISLPKASSPPVEALVLYYGEGFLFSLLAVSTAVQSGVGLTRERLSPLHTSALSKK